MQTPEQFVIDELKRIVTMQAKQIDLLIKENEQIKEQLNKIQTKKNSRNSSVPPSKDENRPNKTNSLRTKSGRKPGGQPGHKGNTLKMSEHPDEIVDHHICFCPECGRNVSELPCELSSKRQVIEIPCIKHVITEHRTYQCTCNCGKVVKSNFPTGINHPVSYGPNMESLVGYLSTRQYLPFKRLQELLNDIFSVPISEGGLHCLLNRLAKKGKQAYKLIRLAIMNSEVIGTDETGMKVSGKNHWFWTWQSNHATYIACSSNRGTNTIDNHADDIWEKAVLVHDCWKAHFNTSVDFHQLCTIHLVRELKYFEELYKTAWPVRFRLMLYQAYELKKKLKPEDYYGPNHHRNVLENELNQLLGEDMDPKYKELVTFQKRIIKYRDYLFTFLYHPKVPAHNNDSERAIRNIKVKQKISGQFKIFGAAENFAILRSIIDTAIKNKQNVLAALNVIANHKVD